VNGEYGNVSKIVEEIASQKYPKTDFPVSNVEPSYSALNRFPFEMPLANIACSSAFFTK